jgi:hypothetical protein
MTASTASWAYYANWRREAQVFTALRDRATDDESDTQCAVTLDGYVAHRFLRVPPLKAGDRHVERAPKWQECFSATRIR